MAATTTTPATTDCTGELCWLLNRASHVLTTELTAALEGLGLSPRAASVLSAATTGELTQIELATITGLDKTTMVVTLDELERDGLAERRPSPVDRRARIVAVTKAGERKLRKADEITAAVREDVLSVLPETERDAFVASLTKLVQERLNEPVRCAQPVRRRAPRT